MILIAFAALIATPSSEPQERLADYAACVAETSAAFKAGDLSGDSSQTIIRAAQVACRVERTAFVDAVDAFTKERHPDLNAGGRAKVTDLFVRMREQEIETAVTGQFDGKGSN
jgi:hypothetical protein